MPESYVKRHVSYFREVGALHELVKGHRLHGKGHEAAVIGVTAAGRELAVNHAVEYAAQKPVRKEESCAPFGGVFVRLHPLVPLVMRGRG